MTENADLPRAGTAFGPGLTLAAVGSVTSFMIVSKVLLYFYLVVQLSLKKLFSLSISTGYVWE
jgi:hypothetical protein